VIATEDQRHLAALHRRFNHLRSAFTSFRDLRKVTGIGGTGGSMLGKLDWHVAEIVDVVSKLCELFVQTGKSEGGRPHVNTTASCTEIHGRADDGNV
jgi:hypothetical protein